MKICKTCDDVAKCVLCQRCLDKEPALQDEIDEEELREERINLGQFGVGA